MPKTYNSNLVTSNRSYNIFQICALYKNAKLHPQTIRGWIKDKGLRVISSKPIMIYGGELKEFLKERVMKDKKVLAFNEFKCLKCKEVAPPLNNSILLIINKNMSFRGVGVCQICGSENSKFYKRKDIELLKITFFLKNSEVLTLTNTSPSASNTHMNKQQKAPLSEPLKNSVSKSLKAHTPIQLDFFKNV